MRPTDAACMVYGVIRWCTDGPVGYRQSFAKILSLQGLSVFHKGFQAGNTNLPWLATSPKTGYVLSGRKRIKTTTPLSRPYYFN